MRTLTSVAALALALTLTACGGSSDEPSDAASSAAPSESASGSASGSASSEPSDETSEEPAAEATPDDYAALITVLAGQQPAIAESDTVEEVAQNADFPAGTEVAEFDKAATELCIQQVAPAIAVELGGTAVIAYAGPCDGGEEVARLTPQEQDPDQVDVGGDPEIGAAVEKAFREQILGE